MEYLSYDGNEKHMGRSKRLSTLVNWVLNLTKRVSKLEYMWF